MKRLLLVGTALALTGLLMFSCNKHRFDLDTDNMSVVGSGQWKLPIGTMRATIGSLLDQMGENNMVSPDDDGNLQIAYQFAFDNLVKGSSFLSLGTLNFSHTFELENPYPGAHLPEPIDAVWRFPQVVELNADSASIETAIIKSGSLILTLQNNLTNISRIDISSPDITMLDGDTLYVTSQSEHIAIDLTGATFRLHDENGVADSTFTLNYAFYYQITGIDNPMYEVNSIIALQNLKLSELSGYVNSFVYDFTYDSAFKLPLDHVQGQMTLVGAKIQIQEKNTFGGLTAELRVNRAEFYGGGATPSQLFNNYPFVLDVVESPTYIDIMPEESINIGLNTKFDAFLFDASLDLNPSAMDHLIHIYDTSSLGMKFNAVVPMRFNIPGVYYLDTMDLNMSDITAIELINEILLTAHFDSEMPFNMDAQFYTLNSQTGHITDSLLVNPLHIGGSFAGQPVPTDAEISVTQDRLNHFVQADKLVMRFGIDTDNQDVILNLDNALSVTLKADVIYGGEVDINQ